MGKLIITADDFGLCESVNSAIIECVESGVVLSTNVMTNMPCAKDAEKLKIFGRKISIGLHWNLTTGSPVTPTEELSDLITKDGKFLDTKLFKEKIAKNLIKKKEIIKELYAQYKLYVSLIGEEPSYWNTHQNIHINISLFKIFMELALELGITRMRSHNKIIVRSSGQNRPRINSISDYLKTIVIASWNRYARKKGARMPDGVLTFENHFDKYNIKECFLGKCSSSSDASIAEMIIHPSTSAKGEFLGSIREGRVKEYNAYKNRLLIDDLKDRNIELSNYWSL